ncbi:MAG: DUF3822 family protein [Bacteroidales bacterium]|nr:DUF3822 family protein [Candidatus Colimorpha onthohippi]
MYQISSIITTPQESPSYVKRLTFCLTPKGFYMYRVSTQGTLLSFVDVVMDWEGNIVCMSNQIMEFLQDQNISMFDYESVRLVCPTMQAVWMPDELYSAKHDRDYLGSVTTIPDGCEVLNAYSSQIDAYCIFAVDSRVVTAFKIVLPGIRMFSQHNMLLSPSLFKQSDSHPIVLLSQFDTFCSINVVSHSNLLLSNSFKFSSSNERLFRLIRIVKFLDLDSTTTELRLGGLVDRSDYNTFVRYFSKVTLNNGDLLRFENPEFQHLHRYRYLIEGGC